MPIARAELFEANGFGPFRRPRLGWQWSLSRRPVGWRGRADLTAQRLDWTGASNRAPGPFGFDLDQLAKASIPGRRAPFVGYDFSLRDGRFLGFLSMDDATVRAWLEAAGFQILISPARPEFATVLPPGEPFEWADIGRE